MKAKIKQCKCGNYEYEEKMRWLSGNELCRNCYKERWCVIHDRTHYPYNDLNGDTPTQEEIDNFNKEQNEESVN